MYLCVSHLATQRLKSAYWSEQFHHKYRQYEEAERQKALHANDTTVAAAVPPARAALRGLGHSHNMVVSVTSGNSSSGGVRRSRHRL